MSVFARIKAALGRNRTRRVDIESRFELLREAVSGTMSSFYMAKDCQSGRIVGLKICDSQKVQAFESRFRGLDKPSEGAIGSSLQHPHIVETLEHGVTTNESPYVVMEFIEGPGLHSLLQTRESVLIGKRVPLIKQMAAALDHVHKAKYIHRDICPRNFICAPDATSLKLIDFGLTLPAKREFMQPGNRTGTPMYMAPEIVKRRWTDQRVDIFSLGVTVYHLCAFALPWPAAENPAMTAMSHASVPPIDILELVENLHPDLARAIMQCLAAEPAQRPNTAADFLHSIRRVENEYR